MDFFEILSAFGIPLSISGIAGLLISAIITAASIIAADKIIAHNVQTKHAIIMALLAYFVTPLLLTGLALAGINLGATLAVYIIPLIVWIALGEILLDADVKTKAIVAIIAFVIYMILSFIGVPAMIYKAIPI